jgi:hypothetical protein
MGNFLENGAQPVEALWNSWPLTALQLMPMITFMWWIPELIEYRLSVYNGNDWVMGQNLRTAPSYLFLLEYSINHIMIKPSELAQCIIKKLATLCYHPSFGYYKI